jgi:hypothetical protein
MDNKEIKSYTHVALVLDASGSMGGFEDKTISTMKEFFRSLKSDEDKTVIDLWQFDDEVCHLIDGVDLSEAEGNAIEGYKTGGCTALYDAICIGIDDLGKKFAAMKEEDRPDMIVFAILTDGFENASQKFKLQDVKDRIQHQSEKYSWSFRFLAANQDAVLTGHEMGLEAKSCMTFDASPEGIKTGAAGLSAYCCGEVREMSRMRRAERMKGKAPSKAKAPAKAKGKGKKKA